MANPKTEARLELTAVDKASAVIKRVQGSVKGLQLSYAGLAAGVTAALGGAGLGAFVVDAVRYRSALDDLADTLGDNVKSLDGLARQARVSGIELGQLGGIVSKFARNIGEANDNTRAAAAAIGLNIDELRAKKPAEAFHEVALALGQYEDGSKKVAVATALLGKAGAEALPFLKDLAESGELAGKVTAEEAAQAERLEKEWRKLGIAFDDVQHSIAGGIIPTISRLVEEMREGVRIAGSFGEALRLFGTMNPLNSPGENAAAQRQRLEDLQAGRARLASLPGYEGAVAAIDRDIADAQKRLEFAKLQQRQQALEGVGPGILDARDLQAQQKRGIDYTAPANAAKAETERKRLEKLAEDNRTALRDADEALARLLILGENADAENVATRIGPAPVQDSGRFADIDAMIARAMRGEIGTGEEENLATAVNPEHDARLRQLVETLKTEEQLELDAHAVAMARLQDFSDQELELVGGRQAAEQELERQHRERINAIRSSSNDKTLAMMKAFHAGDIKAGVAHLEGLTANLATGSKKMFQLNKALGMANVVISGTEAVMSAYAWGSRLGGPVGGAAAASVAGAFYLAQLEAIRQTQFGATGGAAPSLAGSTPATPVSPVSSAPADGQTVIIKGVNPTDIFTGKQIRELFERFGEEGRNGSRFDRVIFA
jgi:plasmid maintenance system killer protein